MESRERIIVPYGPEWFKKRALEAVRPLGAHHFDFSDSLLLYTPDSDEGYENLQETESPYHKLVTAPERAYLESIASRIAAELPDEFEYIDLGPGTEHKEQFLFDALKERNKSFTYRPVDISKRFLQYAEMHAQEQNLPVLSLQASFEELPSRLPVTDTPRFVSLGLTYSNYEPHEALKLLRAIAGPGGYAFINSQLRERTDMDELVRIYGEDAKSFIDQKMKLLDLDAADVRELVTDDGIQVWCKVDRPTAALTKKGVVAGDTFLIFQSLRPSRESLESDIAEEFPNHKTFDTNEAFVGTLLNAG